MNGFLENKINIKIIELEASIRKDFFYNMSDSIVQVTKDELSLVEFKEYLYEIENRLKKKYSLTRVPAISNYTYLFIIKDKDKVEEPEILIEYEIQKEKDIPDELFG